MIAKGEETLMVEQFFFFPPLENLLWGRKIKSKVEIGEFAL